MESLRWTGKPAKSLRFSLLLHTCLIPNRAPFISFDLHRACKQNIRYDIKLALCREIETGTERIGDKCATFSLSHSEEPFTAFCKGNSVCMRISKEAKIYTCP